MGGEREKRKRESISGFVEPRNYPPLALFFLSSTVVTVIIATPQRFFSRVTDTTAKRRVVDIIHPSKTLLLHLYLYISVSISIYIYLYLYHERCEQIHISSIQPYFYISLYICIIRGGVNRYRLSSIQTVLLGIGVDRRAGAQFRKPPPPPRRAMVRRRCRLTHT